LALADVIKKGNKIEKKITNHITMPIIINLDVMLCEKMRSNELADRMGITTANQLKPEKQRRFGSRL
jgi:hypothetical protein